MKSKNIWYLIAGGICLFTAFVHLISGQTSLVNPLLESSLSGQVKTEWLAVWHLITVMLFGASILLLKYGFKPKVIEIEAAKIIGFLFVLMSLVFIGVSLYQQIFAPQWILLLPIGGCCIWGAHKQRQHTINEI